MGIMGYDGHCTSKVHTSEREDCSRKANCLLADTLFYLEAAGLEVPIVSASGTYTYRYASQIDGITEIQAGSYLFADTALRENGQVDFECALSILATVISRQRRPGAEDIAFIDVGRKMIDTYLGLPEVKDPPGAQVLSLSQEHGKISLVGVERDLEVGDRIEIWVRDANGTITLHDRFYALRDDRVEAVWDIPGRGRAT
jgi:D-serine deaminase-like pyridoxal phosphate-dependent protein